MVLVLEWVLSSMIEDGIFGGIAGSLGLGKDFISNGGRKEERGRYFLRLCTELRG